LAVLLCEHCRITDLDPLRGAPLKRLNCAENRLRTGLDALRGMPLEWLNCWATGIESLDPLQGLPLYQLHCDANRIESLEPLRGAPLTEITCGGNRISRLDPLRGCPLNTIQAPHNRFAASAPAQPAVEHHPCPVQPNGPSNRCAMAMTSLMCGGNDRTSPVVKNPPQTFLLMRHDPGR
jgi:Leucine-rich repeat (LRR) protein